jgi:NodT family efflux transporter outer membrane factor (OMF) lipoprotein
MSILVKIDTQAGRKRRERRLVRRSLRSFKRRSEVGERRHRRELNLGRLGGCRFLPSWVHQLVPANCLNNHQSPISDLLRIRIVFLRWDLLPAQIRRHADTPTCPTTVSDEAPPLHRRRSKDQRSRKLPEFQTTGRSRIRRYGHDLLVPLRRALALAGFTFVAGCAVGPNFQRPAAPAVNGYTPEPLAPKTAKANIAGGEAQRFVQGMDIPGQWWRLFHSEPLNRLVEEAIKNNPSIEAAQQALRVARENVAAQKGSFYPSVTASLTPSRNKTATGALSPASASGNPYYSLYTSQLSISYVPDVFGLNRRTVESLQAQADAQRFQVEATYLTLTSNVVAAAIQEASLRGQIAATQEIIKVETEALQILRRQLELGQVAGADVAAQEAVLAQAQASLPPLQKQLAQQRDLLAALTGHFPSEEVPAKFTLADVQLPHSLPVSLPVKLIEQRPDVRMAEEQLHSTCAEIGVGVANLLPNLTLSALGGNDANKITQLFGPGTGYWTLAATVTQPVFEGGTLLHRFRAAQGAYDEAAAQYRSTVITAFQNVADSLRALQSDANALAAAVAAEHAAATSLGITRRQLELGQVGYLSLVSAEQTYQTAVISLVQTRTNRYADTAALFQALGGGWWNRSDVASASPKRQASARTVQKLPNSQAAR